MIPEWVRYIWHPTYGHYGGRKARCKSLAQRVCPVPIDAMDVLFAKHDKALREARKIYSPGAKRETALQKADEDLARGLNSLPKFTGYKYPLWGPIYRFLASIPFSAV